MTKDQLYTLATGACIMASGGGGSYQITCQLITGNVSTTDTIEVVEPSAVGAAEWLGGAAAMFPPDAFFVNPDAIEPIANAFFLLEAAQGVTFAYFHPLEVGAVNTICPMIAMIRANQTQGRTIKIIDADAGGGRAIPTLPLIVFARYHFSWSPNYTASSMTDEQFIPYGQFHLQNGEQLEAAMNTLIMNQFDQVGGFSLFPMTGQTLQENPSVFGTISQALVTGQIYQDTQLSPLQKAHSIAEFFTQSGRSARIVFAGNIIAMNQQTGGTDTGYIMVEGSGDDQGWRLKIMITNENIIAYKYQKRPNRVPYIIGPDSISYIPADGSAVFDNSDLANRLNCCQQPAVYILAITAPSVVTSSPLLMANWAKLRAQLGYEGNYQQPWLMPI